MTRVGLLVIGLVLLVAAAAASAEQTARWKVVCDHDDTTAASHCYLSFFAEDKASGNWLGIAVQRLHGSHEIQVISNGEAYSRAEINVQSDTTNVTDYCYGTYCVFVRADELVPEPVRFGTLPPRCPSPSKNHAVSIVPRAGTGDGNEAAAGGRGGEGAEQLIPFVSMHMAVSLIPVAMAPLSRIIATASAVPTMARIITYSAAVAPLSSPQKRAKDLAAFLIFTRPFGCDAQA